MAKETKPDLDRIYEYLTKDLLYQLVDFAEKRIERFNFLYGGNSTSQGKQGCDFVQEAIASVLEGRRRWNPSVEFPAFICGVIKSMISHAYESKEAQITERETTLANRQQREEHEQFSLDNLQGSGLNPAEYAHQAEVEKRMWKIMGDLEDDPLLAGIFQCVFDGITQPAKIARSLETSVNEINKGKKRLQRRLKQYTVSEE